jgi:uncharacterized membrane protein YkvA (DUF1232 family)
MWRRIAVKLAGFFLLGFKKKARRWAASPAAVQRSLAQTLAEPEKIRGPIRRLRHDLTLLFGAARAWLKGEYRQMPLGSLVMLLGALFYFLAPLDLAPDFLPLLGFVDDALVLGLTLKQIRADLRAFELWQAGRD